MTTTIMISRRYHDDDFDVTFFFPTRCETRKIEEVRCVISIKGMDEQLGIMSTREALQRASDEGLDLVMITKDAEPPVVKIIDYGKFK